MLRKDSNEERVVKRRLYESKRNVKMERNKRRKRKDRREEYKIPHGAMM